MSEENRTSLLVPHTPRILPRDKDTEGLLMVTPIPVDSMNFDRSLAKLCMATENIDLSALRLRMQHIHENLSESPSVLFIDIDPYVPMSKESLPPGFEPLMSHPFIPKTPEALASMAQTGSGLGCVADATTPRASAVTFVSNLSFDSKGDKDLHALYDSLYEAGVVVEKNLAERERISEKHRSLTGEATALSRRISQTQDVPGDDNPDVLRLNEMRDELVAAEQEMRQAEAQTNDAYKKMNEVRAKWDQVLEKELAGSTPSQFVVSHFGASMLLESIIPERSSWATRRSMEAAAFDPNQLLVVVGYHGDIKIRRNAEKLGPFVEAWLDGRKKTAEKYRSALERVKEQGLEDSPDKWPSPNRVTDYYIFAMHATQLKDFFEECLQLRGKIMQSIHTIELEGEKEEEQQQQQQQGQAEKEAGVGPKQ